MIDENDIKELKDVSGRIAKIRDKIDCHYCREHMDVILNLLSDATDISKFNMLYSRDPDALNRLRDAIQSERMLRVLAFGSKMVGVARKIRLVVGWRKNRR